MGRCAGGRLFPLDSGGYGAPTRPVWTAGGAPSARGSGAGRPARRRHRLQKLTNGTPRRATREVMPLHQPQPPNFAPRGPAREVLNAATAVPSPRKARPDPASPSGRPSHRGCGPDAYSSYTRYQFSSRSAVIRKLFTCACDLLEVAWQPWGKRHISVARREAVQDSRRVVGPKLGVASAP
jgi:hypothetical protein